MSVGRDVCGMSLCRDMLYVQHDVYALYTVGVVRSTRDTYLIGKNKRPYLRRSAALAVWHQYLARLIEDRTVKHLVECSTTTLHSKHPPERPGGPQNHQLIRPGRPSSEIKSRLNNTSVTCSGVDLHNCHTAAQRAQKQAPRTSQINSA